MSKNISADAQPTIKLRIPMRGLSTPTLTAMSSKLRLRIPMRGYESRAQRGKAGGKSVTNPHAGL